MIAESRTYQIGAFTINERPRPDNPYWPVYIVSYKGRVIGRGFSKPSEDDCNWMRAQPAGETRYAESSAPLPKTYTVSINGLPRRSLTEGKKTLARAG